MKYLIQIIIMFCVSSLSIIYSIKNNAISSLYTSLIPVLFVAIFIFLVLYWEILWNTLRWYYSKITSGRKKQK